VVNSSTHIKDIKNHNVLQRSGRAHNIEMSSVQSGRAQRTHAFLGVIIRPLPIHWQIPGRVLQLLNWFQLMGVLDPYSGPPLKFSCELLLIQIMLHKTVQTTHHLKLLLFAFHHCKDFRACQVLKFKSLIDQFSWKPLFDLNSSQSFFCAIPIPHFPHLWKDNREKTVPFVSVFMQSRSLWCELASGLSTSR